MKERSYRRWLLHSFLLAGVVPLLICVVLILGLFQTSVERYAAGQEVMKELSITGTACSVLTSKAAGTEKEKKTGAKAAAEGGKC